MGKKLSELNQQNSATQEEYLLIDKDNQNESYKIKLKDIDITNFLKGYLVNEIEEAKNELGGTSLYEGIQALFDNVPHTHFTNRITSNNTTQAPTVKAVYDYILENGGGGGGGTGTGGSGIKEKVDNPKLWELTSGMYEVTSGFYYTVDNYQSLENTSAILFIGDDSPEQDINYFMIAGRVKYYGVMKIDGTDGTIVTEDFSNEEINESSTNKDIPSSKVVYDFVTSETKAKVSTKPNIWELDKGWHYIKEGFYLGRGEDRYVKVEDSALIYKTGDPVTICQFYGIGCVYSEQMNLIRGQVLEAITYCDITCFTEEINAESPLNHNYTAAVNHNYPSEKAVVDFVQKQLNSLIDTAPDKLNTLNELANALNNDENFASTVMEQIGKKIDKEAITTEVSGNSTDDEIASAKAVYDFVVNNKEIEVVSNPKIWELESGLYRVQGGFYHSNEKEVNDLVNGETSTTTPNQSTVDYEAIDHEMFLMVYKQPTDDPNTICRFVVFGDDTDSYSGTITMSLSSFEDNMYAVYSGNLVSITKTDLININSTINEYPSAKAVYDYVKKEIDEIGISQETLDTFATKTELKNSNKTLIDYINEHLGDISDLITDRVTEEGLDGTNKVELPTARAMKDYLEANQTLKTQIQIITWEEND